MKRKVRAVRSAGGEVATCNEHLPVAVQLVTAPGNGETHIVVRRLTPGAPGGACTFGGDRPHDAAWLLIPQAVIA